MKTRGAVFGQICFMKYYSGVKKDELELHVWVQEKGLDILPRGANSSNLRMLQNSVWTGMSLSHLRSDILLTLTQV